MNITSEDIVGYGFIITALFNAAYPTGTTLEQLEMDAESNGWVRAIINSLTKTKEYETYVDVSEVGM